MPVCLRLPACVFACQQLAACLSAYLLTAACLSASGGLLAVARLRLHAAGCLFLPAAAFQRLLACGRLPA